MKKGCFLTMLVFILLTLCSACGNLPFSEDTFLPSSNDTVHSTQPSQEVIETEKSTLVPTIEPTTSQIPSAKESPDPREDLTWLQGIPQSEMTTTYKVCGELYECILGDSYVYCQISGLDEPERESRINQELKEAAVSWFNESILGTQSGNPYIHWQTEKYLVIVYEYLWPERNRPDYFYVGVTIDMETGKRVFVHDLVDINSKFLSIIRDTEFESIYANEWIEGISDEELLSFLNSCQMDNDELRQYLENVNDTNQLNTFSLHSGELTLMHVDYKDITYFTINLDDIEEFLKVPKW